MAATGKTNAAELTAQEKAAATLAIVERDGAAAMGDFARTADGAANKTKTATAAMEDQQTKLGSQLLPIWTDFLGFLTDVAIPAFGTLVTWISENASWLGPLAIAVGVITVAQWAWNAAMMANPIGLVIGLIAALVAGIVWVATQTTFFQDVWTAVTTALGTAWQWLWDTVLNPIFTAIGAIFTWIYETIILPVVTGIMLYIGLWAAVFTWLYNTVIAPVIAGIGAVIQWVWTSVIQPVITFIQAGIYAAGVIFEWLNNTIVQPVMRGIGAAFQWVWGSVIQPVVNFISGAIRTVGDTVSSVFGGIAGFIGGAFQAVLGVIRGPINGIIGLVNSAIRGINSLKVTIPDWVPIVGGQTWGLSIPTIPMLARGTLSAPNAFIAGENGPELIVGGAGSRVYPERDTRRILGREDRGGGDQIFNVTVNEATDPLGTTGRLAHELRKWKR
jgi:phage-related protein